jgi:hypothetical protein
LLLCQCALLLHLTAAAAPPIDPVGVPVVPVPVAPAAAPHVDPVLDVPVVPVPVAPAVAAPHVAFLRDVPVC